MKILIISQLFYPDTCGGTDRYVYEQAKGLARRHQVTVFTLHNKSGLAAQETRDGFNIKRFSNSAESKTYFSLFKFSKFLKPLIDKNKFDLVLLHHSFTSAAFYKLKINLPSIYFFHASYYREFLFDHQNLPAKLFSRVIKNIEKNNLKQANKIIVLSDFSKKLLAETYPAINFKKIIKIPGGVDIDKFIPALKNNSRPRLITVRRLSPRMGLENLITAASQIKEDFELFIIGDGPEKNNLKCKIENLKLKNKIILLGQVSDQELIKHYQQADLFILPTLAYEGFGLVTLEALACGTPVMATPVGATPEILSQLDKKLLFKDHSSGSIAVGLTWFLKNKPRYQTREFVVKNYSWDKVINSVEKIIHENFTNK